MPKLLWVALPLLLALAVVGLAAARRRPWSRQALNVGSSLLLLAYVATTAGLGIFWVAHQQLPVFDWHYLFGYLTVVLVLLHLAFNWRVVWRQLQRRRGGAPALPDAAGTGRRGLVGAAALLLTAGAAFWLGLRHGRTELHLAWPAAGGGTPADADTRAALTLVERYHEHTVHSRRAALWRAPGVDWGDPPPPFKRYAGRARLALPTPARGATGALDLATLASLLWHTVGITAGGGPVPLRAAPSSGALFATELYVAARRVDGLAPGLWHHGADHHGLVLLRAGAPVPAQLGLPDTAPLNEAPLVLVFTALFRRSGHKYRDRTYRYVLADLGHALENLRVAATALGLQARLVERFDGAPAAAALGLDEAEEGVIALAALWPASRPLPAVDGAALASADTAWQPPAAPDGRALPLGVTAALHRVTSLQLGAGGAGGAGPAPATSVPEPAAAIVLPAPRAVLADPLPLIATRRSVRRYARTPLALAQLGGVLAALGADRPLLSAALRVHVVVHAVAELAPGVYRHDAARHTLWPVRQGLDLRRAARAAALDQDVIGDAAAVLVFTLDRQALAVDRAGPARGYRHAFLEAGLLGERVYLAAAALGLAACGVGAFYDDEAQALLALDPAHAWVVHFAAIGLPQR